MQYVEGEGVEYFAQEHYSKWGAKDQHTKGTSLSYIHTQSQKSNRRSWIFNLATLCPEL